MDSIKCKIQKCIHYSKETGFVVLSLETSERKTITARGTMYEKDIPVGAIIVVNGEWESNPRFGQQFKIASYSLAEGNISSFLVRIVKISENIVSDMLDFAGSEEALADILDTEPHKLLEVNKIGKKRLEKIIEKYKDKVSIRELSKVLAPAGATPHIIYLATKFFGEKAKAEILGNPYSLTRLPGVGFKKADSIAISLGVDKNSDFRIQACIKYSILKMSEEKGDTAVLPNDLTKRVCEELTIESDTVEKLEYKANPKNVLEHIKKMSGPFDAEHDLVNIEESVAYKWLYSYERRIHEIIQRRLQLPKNKITSDIDFNKYAKNIKDNVNPLFKDYSDEQKKFINMVCDGHKTIILCGYAGTGKTTTSRTSLDILAEKYGRDNIICMALSGIASDRIRKTTGFQGYTIHVSLKWNGKEFQHNKKNPLPYKVVVVDESSMINSDIFNKILEAIRDDSILILIGDDAQLPPIGAGNVFCDLIGKEHVPMIKLTKIYRQSEESVLTSFAAEIRKGVIPDKYNKSNYIDFEFSQKGSNLFNIKRKVENGELPKSALETARAELNESILKEMVRYSVDYKQQIKNMVTDFQVITPMRKGYLGTENLNIELQKIFNPQKENLNEVFVVRYGTTFRVHDKVVHLKNMNMQVMLSSDFKKNKEWESDLTELMRIYNGSIGIVVKIDTEDEKCYVNYPDAGGGIIVQYNFEILGDAVEHAFCLSCHKCQGSEFKWVVVPISSSHFIMLTNKWLYTAMTRAKDKCIVVGQDYMFKKACKTNDETKRKTVLQLL